MTDPIQGNPYFSQFYAQNEETNAMNEEAFQQSLNENRSNINQPSQSLSRAFSQLLIFSNIRRSQDEGYQNLAIEPMRNPDSIRNLNNHLMQAISNLSTTLNSPERAEIPNPNTSLRDPSFFFNYNFLIMKC